ncbi:hypothetical protein OIV83_004195 [Microbotryomycetes sp. JL201]|nr:hypothetical protein OIV83_004195 [Microbotryomycetes sp. JL201]
MLARQLAMQSLMMTSRRAVAPAVSLGRVGRRFASSKQLDPILYTASATSTGSRASGTAETKQGNISVQTHFPKEASLEQVARRGPRSMTTPAARRLLGGKDHTQGTTDPEQLFALAYGTCFLSALGATHKNLSPDLKPLPKSTQVRTHVSIGTPSNGLPGFLLAVKIEVLLGPLKEAGLDQAGARKLIEGAHKLCPYSRALAGNIETTITLVEK